MKTNGLHTGMRGAAQRRDSQFGGTDTVEYPCAFALPSINLCGGLWHS